MGSLWSAGNGGKVRVPESLLPTVYQLLDPARKDVEDAAWLDL
jgi:hypothetical protein